MARGPSQGEALATWALWGLITAVVLVTYSRLDPAETYHVSREGLAGGLSRSVTLVNFPIALVAIALVLVAVAALPRSAWWAAAPAIVLCATIPWFVDQSNLDAHWGNAVPALGVVIAAVLTVAATRRAGASFAPRRPWDVARLVLAAVVLLVSLPWITADLGFHFPGDLFMGEELGREKDGTLIAAVHLGHHHGLDGALLVRHGAAALARLDRRSRAAGRALLVPRRHVRLRRRQLRAGRLERAARQARLDGCEHPVRDPALGEADLARRRGARRGDRVRPPPREQAHVILRRMTSSMVFLGFGKYARADKIYALEPITGDDRGGGRRTRVWVEGVAEPLVASRTERTILHDMGHEAGDTVLLDGALDLAERLASAAEEGRVDLNDLGRRARRLLAATARPAEAEPLF